MTQEERPPTRGRSRMRTADLHLLQRASLQIVELGLELDSQLSRETRESERLRMLRESTNRITRIANDAINAYQRASRAVSAELARPGGNAPAADELRAELLAARAELLRVLKVAGERYPPKEEWAARPDPTTAGRRSQETTGS